MSKENKEPIEYLESLIGSEVKIILKTNLEFTGMLKGVDPYLSKFYLIILIILIIIIIILTKHRHYIE